MPSNTVDSPVHYRNIFCFGDSITQGELDLSNGGWVERIKRNYWLQESKFQKQEKTTTYNLGVAGETSDGLSARLKTELTARLIKQHENIVIIQCSINDLVMISKKNTKQTKHKVPQEYFMRNIRQVIQFAQALNCRVFINEILPISPSLDGKKNAFGDIIFLADIEKYNQLLHGLAKQEQCELIKLYRNFNHDMFLTADGIHPNDEGHCYIAEKIYLRITAKKV